METAAGWNSEAIFRMAEKVSRRSLSRWKGLLVAISIFTSVGEMRAEERCVQYHRAIQELMEVESSRQDDASSLACESWLNKVVVQLCATCVNATALPPISPKPWLATMVIPRQGELAVLDSYLPAAELPPPTIRDWTLYEAPFYYFIL